MRAVGAVARLVGGWSVERGSQRNRLAPKTKEFVLFFFDKGLDGTARRVCELGWDSEKGM